MRHPSERPIWTRAITALAILILAALACNAPLGPAITPTPTFLAGLVPTSTLAVATEVPASTPTPGPSPTSAGPTVNPGSQQCAVTATEAVNVRTGPSTQYLILRVLGQGEQAVVTGHNGDRSWWQITGGGWVSAAYVGASGNCTNIAAASYPPPPTPRPATNTPLPPTNTPTATATATNTPGTTTPTVTLTPTPNPVNFTAVQVPPLWTCGSEGRVSISITNTGTVPIEWAQYRLEQPVGTFVNGGYTNAPWRLAQSETSATCASAGAAGDTLAAGAQGWLHLTGTLTSGTAARAIIKLCSQNSSAADGSVATGYCREATIDFTP